MSVRDLLPWRQVLPPAEPAPRNLIAESRDREDIAMVRAALLVRADITHAWPDPYGPDLVVFGPWPRVRGN